MEIKQLKLNGTAFYPKVGVDSIVNAAGEASAVDSTPTDGSTNLVTSGGVYSAIQQGSGSGAVKKIKSSGVEVTPDANGVADIGYIMSGKQDKLISGTSIKTINNESLLGSGNITTASQSELTNLATTVGNHTSAITALNTAVFKNGDNQFDVVNGRVDSISSVLDSALTDIENVETAVADKQDTLVSGTNIKTVNGNSLLGSGNIEIGGSGTVDAQMSNSSANPVQNKVVTENLLSIAPIVRSEENFGNSCIQVVNKLRVNNTQINPWTVEGDSESTFVPHLIEFTVGVVNINSSTRVLNTHTFSYVISPGEGTEPSISGREYSYQGLIDKFVSDLCELYPSFGGSYTNSMIIRKSREGDHATVEFNVTVDSTTANANHYQIVLSSFEIAGYDTVAKDTKVFSINPTTSSTLSDWNSEILYKTMSISKGDLGTIVTNPQTLWFNTTVNHLMILDGQGRIYDCTTGSKFAFAPNYQQS